MKAGNIIWTQKPSFFLKFKLLFYQWVFMCFCFRSVNISENTRWFCQKPPAHQDDVRRICWDVQPLSHQNSSQQKFVYPPGNQHIPQKWHFEDDFPFPKVGYVNSLEGIFKSRESRQSGPLFPVHCSGWLAAIGSFVPLQSYHGKKQRSSDVMWSRNCHVFFRK